MNFISEDFHLHYISSYTLFIQSDFKTDYLIVVNDVNEVLVFLQYDNLQPSSAPTRILSLPFTQVLIGMTHQNLVWVPSDVFNESDKYLFTPYFLNEDVESIISKKIDYLDVVALYQYDQLLINRWLKIFPEVKCVPYFEVLLRKASLFIAPAVDVLGVHVYDQQVDIFLFINGEFKMYNTFEVVTVDDLNYFILSTMKNFSLTGKVQKLLLSGLSEKSEWSDGLANYTDDLVVLKSLSPWVSENAEVQVAMKSLNILADTVLCV